MNHGNREEKAYAKPQNVYLNILRASAEPGEHPALAHPEGTLICALSSEPSLADLINRHIICWESAPLCQKQQ